MPIITLEVMPDSSISETVPYDAIYPDSQANNTIEEDIKDPNGLPFLKQEESSEMHFLVDKTEPTEIDEQHTDQDSNITNLNVRTDLLEYTIRSDGSVSCKVCGKVLASRSQWYRHKYREHGINPVIPAPLFQCEQCLIYFKSRKGYIGHISSKHSETLQDASPVLTNAQAEALAREQSIIQQHRLQSEANQPELIQLNPDNTEPSEANSMPMEVKKEPDPELSIPKTVVPTYQNVAVKHTTTRTSTELPPKKIRSTRQTTTRGINVLEHMTVENEREWMEQRSREDKLVADIIARVRRECEAQGSGAAARRGYSRKSVHT